MSENQENNTQEQELDLNQLMLVRREKLDKLKQDGKDPYEITKFNRTHTSKQIMDNYDELEGKDVTVAGRIMAKRIMGKASFCHIQDSEGKIQSYVSINELGEEEKVEKNDSIFEEIAELGGPKIENLEQFFGNIQEIAQLDPKFLRLPLDEPMLEINANTRKINIDSTDFKANGISVQGDHLAETVFFKIDRYFDYIDLTYCKENNIKLGIATSNSRDLAEGLLMNTGVWQYLDAVWTSDEAKAGKPAPDVYLKVAESLGVKPERCLVFEDVPNGILAGINAGMKVCAVEDPFSNPQIERKKELADYYIQDYDDIKNNTYEVL